MNTYMSPYYSQCHDAKVWLVWRSDRERLEWSDVPCTAEGCDATYVVEREAPIEDRIIMFDPPYPEEDELFTHGVIN